MKGIHEYKRFTKHLYQRMLNLPGLTEEDLMYLLRSNKKEIIISFLFDYENFTNENFILIEKFINDNLTHKDRMYVSDLIEVAIDFNLELNYELCLSFLNYFNNNNHYVLLSTIEYIGNNFKFSYIEQIVDKLENIVYNKKTFDTAKVFASFYLYRITYKECYLKILNDNSFNNYELINNLLLKSSNSFKYFEGHQKIIRLIQPYAHSTHSETPQVAPKTKPTKTP